MTDRQLFEAVEGGDYERVKQLLLSQRVDVNQAPRYQEGINPLMRACEKGDLKMITLLIENGASLASPVAEDGSNPLIIACEFGNLEIVQFLFEKGSSLEPISQTRKRIALSSVCEKGDFEIAKFLIEKGVKVDQTKPGKSSVLHQVCASKFVNLPVVKILVENGADVNEIYHGRTPLMALLNQTSIYGINTTIKEIVLFLLQNGVEINKTNEDGRTALHLAAHGGKLEIVKLLCEYGADPEIKNNSGQTPADSAYSPRVKKFFKEYIHIDGSIKPAKRDVNEKIESNGKEEQREEGEEQREEGEERESKKRKIGAECGFGDEIEFKKPRMD